MIILSNDEDEEDEDEDNKTKWDTFIVESILADSIRCPYLGKKRIAFTPLVCPVLQLH